MYKLDLPTHDAHITIWYLCCRCAIYGRRDEGHTTVDVDFEMSKRNQSVKRAPRSRHKTHTSINMQATQRNLRPRHIEKQPDLSRYNVQASLQRSAPCDTCAYGCQTSDGTHHCDVQPQSSNISDRICCPVSLHSSNDQNLIGRATRKRKFRLSWCCTRHTFINSISNCALIDA